MFISTRLTRGLILLESPPSLFIASRMIARSTTAGTPVKSWNLYFKLILYQAQNPNSLTNQEWFLLQTPHLQKHSSSLERNFYELRSSILPIKNFFNIITLHLKLITVTNRRFQKYPDRVRKPICDTSINSNKEGNNNATSKQADKKKTTFLCSQVQKENQREIKTAPPHMYQHFGEQA